MLLRVVIDHWFLGSRDDAAAALGLKPQTIAYWIAGHEKIPRRVIDQIRIIANQRTAASKARLHEWITAELSELTLLKASIDALPDLDRRPYENRARPKGGRPERSQKRRLAATKQARSVATRDHPDRVPLDLLALLYEPNQPREARPTSVPGQTGNGSGNALSDQPARSAVAGQSTTDQPDQSAKPAGAQSTDKPDKPAKA